MMVDFSPRSGALGRNFIDIQRELSYAILRILDAGWKRASGAAEVHSGTGEVEITEHLRRVRLFSVGGSETSRRG